MAPASLGEMRAVVTFANWASTADPNSVSLNVGFTDVTGTYFANIEPVSTLVFLAGTQEELNKITHRITVNWNLTLDQFKYVIRTRTAPDQTVHQELYQVKRLEEDSLQIVTYLDCELQSNTPEADQLKRLNQSGQPLKASS